VPYFRHACTNNTVWVLLQMDASQWFQSTVRFVCLFYWQALFPLVSNYPFTQYEACSTNARRTLIRHSSIWWLLFKAVQFSLVKRIHFFKNISRRSVRCVSVADKRSFQLWTVHDWWSEKDNCSLFASTPLFSGPRYPMMSLKFFPCRSPLLWQRILGQNWL